MQPAGDLCPTWQILANVAPLHTRAAKLDDASVLFGIPLLIWALAFLVPLGSVLVETGGAFIGRLQRERMRWVVRRVFVTLVAAV